MTDAKENVECIKLRFGGNDESKKMQKYILKQQFEGFTVSNTDGIHKGYERFQSLLSSTASSSNLQNVAFVSENTSSTNDVSTAYGVSNTSGHYSKHEQLHHIPCCKVKIKLSSMDHERIKKFYKKTGRKLQFDAKEPVGFDKTKVECYNCHKTGHFARECRTKEDNRRRDGWNTGNKDGSRTGKKEESKALVTVDGESVDWTTHSEDDENFAFMASNSSGSDTQVTSCSNECKESYANLKRLYDAQREQLSDASVEIKAYTQGLKKVEAQLVAHQQGQLWYEQKIKFMKIDLDDKTDVLTYHKKLLAKAQKEKDDLEVIVDKWNHSSKNLGKIVNYSMSASDKFGLGYGDYRYSGILSYENEVLQSVFKGNKSDFENLPLHKRLVKTCEMQAVPPPMTGNYLPSGPDVEIDDSQYTYGPQKTQPSESESQTTEFDTCDSNISTEPSELVSEPVVNESNVEVQPKDKPTHMLWHIYPEMRYQYESPSSEGVAKSTIASRYLLVNTVSIPVSTASPNKGLSLSDTTNSQEDDSEIPPLEDIHEDTTDGIFTHSSYDDEGAEADFTNLETVVNKEKRRRKQSEGLSSLFILLDFYLNMKQEISEALEDESWLMLARRIGHRQEEGIDYDEVFAPVARLEAIRIFLAFASYMGFIVYQMDVKSAFLYGKIDEEVYVSQPPGFLDPKYPEKVYKVVKALYGLHQAPRAWYATLSTFLLKNGYRRGTIDKTLFLKKDKHDIILVQVYVDDIIFGSTKKSWCDEFEALMKSRFQMSSMGELTFFLGLQVKQKPNGIFISQDKYVAEILKKFDFASVKIASTPIETQKPLVKDEEASDVDVHLYRSMIGSLMYVTASRPDIMFAVCACSRFQVTPKSSHLSVVKRIFRYLKGKPILGLWYPRESSFDLESYSDSDYAGANIDRKSITGGCQFLGRRLITWQCKKQTIVATSTTEAEYVAAASCCGQVFWIQNQMLDYGFNFMNTKIYIDNESTICIVKNPVYHSKTKHIAIRHHFIRDAYEKKLIQVLKIHTNDNVAGLLTKAFDGKNSLVKHFEDMRLCRPSKEYFQTEGNVEFHEVIDFLQRSYIYHALTVSPVVSTTFVEQFWTSAKSKTIKNVRHITAKVAGKLVSISEASIRSDLIFDDADGIDTLPNQAIFDAIQLMGYKGDLTVLTFNKALFSHQWSEVPFGQQPDPSLRPSPRPSPNPSPTPIVPDSIPEPTGENLGDHSSNDTSLLGNEDAMTLQNVYDLCLSLCKQVSDQAKEIKLLKAKITKLKKQAKPVIKHHKAYLKSVSLQQRFPRNSYLKKHRVHKESVSKQGRKNAKGDGKAK
ncbi:putative ribonuclease H-like domain-containing protein [Tanacetum coccineum]|uniref:Ribonuclease H-like domain-containing protein n=1 Tax=Tanacetum coccineum TaxID=301880 RepID=A0ABQ5H025_9ASTR